VLTEDFYRISSEKDQGKDADKYDLSSELMGMKIQRLHHIVNNS
jgi:hypothetical protein